MSHVVAKTSAKELFVAAQVNRMLEGDFSEVSKEEKVLSFLDRRFLHTLESNIQHLSNDHYETPLPLKEEELKLLNNRNLVLSRLHRLKHRLKSDSIYRSHYETFMRDMIDKGQAENVPNNELLLDNICVWYIPHHGVHHPQKPDKIRFVFVARESLNKHFLQGPDLTNNLTGVLCRFRKETVAFICDVEGMFHQVYVHPDYRNFLRFLWLDDGTMENHPAEFRMKVHSFGAASSPGCANFALKRTADDFEDVFGREPADFVRDDFYVDDGLKSVSSATQASSLTKSTQCLLALGGFNFHKFISNSKASHAINLETASSLTTDPFLECVSLICLSPRSCSAAKVGPGHQFCKREE